MNCEELRVLLPDLVEGHLSPQVEAEARRALGECPECQREFEAARQVRVLFRVLRQRQGTAPLPGGLEERILSRLHQERCGLELLDLSSLAFGIWLRELLHMLGTLLQVDLSLIEGGEGLDIEAGQL